MDKSQKTIMLVSNTTAAALQFRGSLIVRLLVEGCKVVVVAQPDGISEHKLVDIGAEFEPVALSRSGGNFFHEALLVVALAKVIHRVKPHAIFSYTIKPNIYTMPLARVFGIPSVAVVTGLGYAFLNAGKKAKIARFLLRIGLRASRHVWFLNSADLDVVCRQNNRLRKISSVLPGEGIDTKKYTASDLPGGPLRFLMISRLLTDKGIREYVGAAREMSEKHTELCFGILGPLDLENPTGITRDELEDSVSHQNIEYLGETEDVRPFIEACHCVVLPSYREGLSRVLLEAAAIARPQIAADVPGCSDVVHDGVTGLLCKARDKKSLVSCFEQFVRLSQEKRTDMSLAARKLVVERFDDEVIFSYYLEMTNRLVSNSKI